ncbi:unnamed protein product [Blepharisma stoltei]|uniref:Chromo domain-containing protein n=1 Tax=Blepharisma stoltei TaxID=1481888 RepID=A0AAU9IBJ4_9CILI|nr:unnamed protein product [Blepharisma stoltei]
MGDHDSLYVIESIVDKKFSTALNSWRYQIKWKGFSSADNTWEPEETVKSVPDLLEQFNEKQERKQLLRREQCKRRNARLRERRRLEREQKLAEQGKLYGDDANKKLKLDDLLPNDTLEIQSPPEKKPTGSSQCQEVNEILNKVREEKRITMASSFPQKKSIQSYEPKIPVTNNNSRFKAEIPRKSETAYREISEEDAKQASSEGLEDAENEEEISYRNSQDSVEESNIEEESETSSRVSNKSKDEANKGNWQDLQPARILGCRKLSGDIYYAVMFKIKKDGTIPPISIVSHKDMKLNAPKMLDKFLLENMIIC